MTATSSLHEKTHADEEDVPPVEDVPDYDDLIESALDALDLYQARRADMNLHLKKVCLHSLSGIDDSKTNLTLMDSPPGLLQSGTSQAGSGSS